MKRTKRRLAKKRAAGLRKILQRCYGNIIYTPPGTVYPDYEFHETESGAILAVPVEQKAPHEAD